MRDMPAFLKICARICLRYAKICRSTGSKCQPLDTTTYEGNFKAIFFLEIFAEIFLFVLLDWNLGEIFRILMLGNLIKSICCLFCMNAAEEVHRFYGSFQLRRKGGRMCLNYQFLSFWLQNPLELAAMQMWAKSNAGLSSVSSISEQCKM